MRTAWTVPRALLGDEFLEATFPAPLRVSGVVVRLRRDSAFPTRFRVAGKSGGRWVELARFDDAHALQLLERLLAEPRTAAIGFDAGRRRARAGRDQPAGGGGGDELRGLVDPGGGGVVAVNDRRSRPREAARPRTSHVPSSR